MVMSTTPFLSLLISGTLARFSIFELAKYLLPISQVFLPVATLPKNSNTAGVTNDPPKSKEAAFTKNFDRRYYYKQMVKEIDRVNHRKD
jgi:hypothetical protein